MRKRHSARGGLGGMFGGVVFLAITGGLILAAHLGVDSLTRRDWGTAKVVAADRVSAETGSRPAITSVSGVSAGRAEQVQTLDPATRQKAEQLYRQHSARISKMSPADMQKALGKASQVLGRDVRGMVGR